MRVAPEVRLVAVKPALASGETSPACSEQYSAFSFQPAHLIFGAGTEFNFACAAKSQFMQIE
jgi:hypothetical protein